MGTPNERSAVEEGAASPERLGKVVPLRVAAQPSPPLEQLVEQTFSIAIGLTALASEVLAEAVARTLGREPFAEGEAPGRRDVAPCIRRPARRGRGDRRRARGRGAGAPEPPPRCIRSAELFFSLVTSPGLRPGAAPPGRVDRLGVLDAKWREQRPARRERRRRRSCGSSIPQVGGCGARSDRPERTRRRADRRSARSSSGWTSIGRSLRLDLDADREPDRHRPHHGTHRPASCRRARPGRRDRVASGYRRDRRTSRSRPGRAAGRHPGRGGQARPPGARAAPGPHARSPAR